MKKLLFVVCVLQSGLVMTMTTAQTTTIQAIAASLATKPKTVTFDRGSIVAQKLIKFNALPFNPNDQSRWCSRGGSKENESWRVGDLMLRCNNKPVDFLNKERLSKQEIEALCKLNIKARQVGLLNNHSQFASPFDQVINTALTGKKYKNQSKK